MSESASEFLNRRKNIVRKLSGLDESIEFNCTIAGCHVDIDEYYRGFSDAVEDMQIFDSMAFPS